MIKYNNILYKDYIHLLYNKLRTREFVNINIFPTHTNFYCRAALQNKFKRRFTLRETRELMSTLPLKHDNIL